MTKVLHPTGRHLIGLLPAQVDSDEPRQGERERRMLRELARGEREIAAGRGVSLERVLADAEKLLARAHK